MCTYMYKYPEGVLTKRDELSLRNVLALPKASMAGLASMIWSSSVPWVQTNTHMLLHVAGIPSNTWFMS